MDVYRRSTRSERRPREGCVAPSEKTSQDALGSTIVGSDDPEAVPLFRQSRLSARLTGRRDTHNRRFENARTLFGYPTFSVATQPFLRENIFPQKAGLTAVVT